MPPIGWHPSKEQIQRLRDSHKGQKPWNTGKHVKLNSCLEPFTHKRGPEHHNWRGGKTFEHIRIRHSQETREWREKVFARDDWTCQECGARGCVLNAHHIFRFADFPELRFEVSNGITLCYPCHRKTLKRDNAPVLRYNELKKRGLI